MKKRSAPYFITNIHYDINNKLYKYIYVFYVVLRAIKRFQLKSIHRSFKL